MQLNPARSHWECISCAWGALIYQTSVWTWRARQGGVSVSCCIVSLAIIWLAWGEIATLSTEHRRCLQASQLTGQSVSAPSDAQATHAPVWQLRLFPHGNQHI